MPVWEISFLIILLSSCLVNASSNCDDKSPKPIDLKNYQSLVCAIEAKIYSPPELSCDLSNLKQYPKVMLIGERHWSSDDSERVKKLMIDRAVAGKIHLLIEVIPDTGTAGGSTATFPWTAKNSEYLATRYISPNIDGIDSFIPKAIMAANTMFNNLKDEIKDGKMSSSTSVAIGVNISSNPVFKAALNRVSRNAIVSCQLCIDAYKKVSENQKFNGKTRYTMEWMEELGQAIRKAPLQQYFSFVRDLYQEIIKIVTPEIKNHLPEHDFTKQNFTESEFHKIMIDWRNEDFAKTIAAWLCSNADSSKSLNVIVGDAHSQGVIANLNKLSKGSGKVQYYRSFESEDVPFILNQTFK